MKPTAYLVLSFFLALKVLGSGSLPSPHKSRIINGEIAAEDSFTHKVALIHSNGQYFCSGSIVDASVVLTAAHCMQEVVGQDGIIAIVGTNNIAQYEPTYQKIRSQNWTVHENYTKTTQYDIAVIKLQTPIELNDYTSILPLYSSDEISLNGYNVTVCGWGYYEVPAASSVLRCMDAHVITNTKCSDIYVNTIGPNFICATGVNNSRTCSGDSGSSLVFQDWRGTYVGVGVLSFGPSNCNPAPVVFTRISKYYDWIINRIQIFIGSN